MSGPTSLPEPWASMPDRFHERGMRWTPQRRTIVEVLAAASGHLTGPELIESPVLIRK